MGSRLEGFPGHFPAWARLGVAEWGWNREQAEGWMLEPQCLTAGAGARGAKPLVPLSLAYVPDPEAQRQEEGLWSDLGWGGGGGGESIQKVTVIEHRWGSPLPGAGMRWWLRSWLSHSRHCDLGHRPLPF